MAYSSIVKPTDYFNTVLYTGDGTTKDITGVGFQPDWVWAKKRSATGFHALADSVRGGTKNIFTNSTGAEETSATDWILSFASDGFGVNSGGNLNQSSATYVAWNWLAANGTASNSDGSITSTVSVNTTAGFSIVSYTGTGSNATVGHGLGVAPSVVITKNRDLSSGGTSNWRVGSTMLGFTKRLNLNTNDSVSTDSTTYNDTDPTSSVFSVGTHGSTNGSTNGIIAYCLAEKKGYSKFGSYSGNGDADGTFVYTGFKPAWIMIKRTDSTANWRMIDSKRNSYNILPRTLTASQNAAEYTGTDDFGNTDILSNGFKIRTSYAEANNSSGSYIYLAFAENPFVANDSGTAVPVVAR
jgi:hypothetical protein